MRSSKIESFTGTLTIWGYTCNFSFQKGYSLEIWPQKEYEEEFRKRCKEQVGVFDSISWIFGTDKWEHNIAFMPSERQGPLSYCQGTLTLIVDIVLRTANTKSHKGRYLYGYKDLKGFTAIDFVGESIDSVFSPNFIVSRKHAKENIIEWFSCSENARIYSTTLDGKNCNLVFTVSVDRQDLEPDNTALGDLRSIMRLEFDERQDVIMIETCWYAVCTFLSFCVGQFNITDMRIGLWDEEKRVGGFGFEGGIECHINNDRVENVHFSYPAYRRFQISSLGNRTGRLFELLNSKSNRPVLGFMPRKNSDISIDRNKLRDICTALEVEYDYRKSDFPNNTTAPLVDILKENVREYRKKNPDLIDAKTYDYVFGSLNHISIPARVKLQRIYSKYTKIINDEFKKMQLYSQQKLILSDDQTSEDIGWIVKARNNITHSSGISEQEIPNAIYARLKVAVYCSILERAGYTLQEIENIMNTYFHGEVPQ